MISRDILIKFIYQTIGQKLLETSLVKDELANGVQFLGGDPVAKVTLGVSLNEDFLQSAVSAGSNFCIFHHAFDVRTFQSRYPVFSQKRLKQIIQNNLTIMGLHYVLDAHPTFGNNAVIIRKLGAKIDQPLFEDWGYTAHFSQPQNTHELVKQCSQLFHHDVFTVLAGPKQVSTIGVVSGGGKPYAEHLSEMKQKKVELFITGEPSESVPHLMKESGINYFACGHYATEVFGVQALGKQIKTEFKNRLAVEFIDTPNSI